MGTSSESLGTNSISLGWAAEVYPNPNPGVDATASVYHEDCPDSTVQKFSLGQTSGEFQMWSRCKLRKDPSYNILNRHLY